jgi:hypothetical protein
VAVAKPAGGRPPRTLKSLQQDLNNGADRDAEIAASKLVDRDSARAPASDETTAADRIDSAGGGAPAAKPFDYDEWFAAQPEEARVTFAKNVVGHYEQNVKETYSPEVFELLEEAGSNPALLKKLQRASKNKDLRTFLFDTAFEIYGDSDEPATPGGGDKKPAYVSDLERQVEALRADRENEKTTSMRQAYEQQRTSELSALTREFPELRFDQTRPESPEYLRVMDIIDRTEAASQKAGKVLSYKDTYERMRTAWGSTDTTARDYVVPRTTPTTGVAPVRQAPVNEKDSKLRMREILDRNGGTLSSLAKALARK